MYRSSSHLILLFSLLLVLVVSATTTPFKARCPAGQGWNGNGCQDCQGGMYSDGITVDTCQDCPVNTISSNKAASCTACSAGSDTRLQTRSTQCQSCPNGSFSSTAGSTCTPCKPGTYAPNQGSLSCTSCPPGSFTRDNGASGCQLCQAGDFNGESGKAECGICPKGYYTPDSGYKACLMCPCGKFGPTERQSSCQECPSQNGVIPPSPPASTSSSQCLDLKANGGFYYDSNKCPAQCPGGTYSVKIQSGSCETCPNGKVSPVGSTSPSQCTSCPGTSVPNSDKTGCGLAPSGGTKSPKKRRRETFLCPRGLEACPVLGLGQKKKKTVFECIDISSNVESCGGCPEEVGGQGEDCTAFDERATASCVKGMCRYECPVGWKVGKKGCERVGRGQKVLSGYKRRSIGFEG